MASQSVHIHAREVDVAASERADTARPGVSEGAHVGRELRPNVGDDVKHLQWYSITCCRSTCSVHATCLADKCVGSGMKLAGRWFAGGEAMAPRTSGDNFLSQRSPAPISHHSTVTRSVRNLHGLRAAARENRGWLLRVTHNHHSANAWWNVQRTQRAAQTWFHVRATFGAWDIAVSLSLDLKAPPSASMCQQQAFSCFFHVPIHFPTAD
jgi:hypothetical protein